MIKAGIIGGSGVVGQTILRILGRHKGVTVNQVVSDRYAGKKISQMFPHSTCTLDFSPMSIESLNQNDVVFIAIPHTKAAPLLSQLKCKVVDMTADHRLTHTYGLPELFKGEIAKAKVIANPGCYATACILTSYPIKENIRYVVFDCISGYSGGGMNHGYNYLENIIAYQLTDHFHIKEMTRILEVDLSFTPHVVNTFSGIMCTAHITLDKSSDVLRLKKEYKKFYEMTSTMIVDGIPCTKEVVGTPLCKIGGFAQEKKNRVVLVSVIDNLMKGAASQAVENMNIMFGLDPKEGIR